MGKFERVASLRLARGENWRFLEVPYADKYRARGEPIHLVGVEFSKDSRNIVAFDVQTLV